MSKFKNFQTTRPTEQGYYWVSNMTVMDEPEIVFVRPMDFANPNSELGFQRMGSSKTKPLSAPSVDMMQWQKAKYV